MSAYWINKLNSSASRLHKEEVVRQALSLTEDGDASAITFLTLIKYCYNPYVTFGVRQVPYSSRLDNESAENPWQEFVQLLDDLHERRFTGKMAINAIWNMCERFSKSEWDTFCAPVIRRDLRAGISSTTINKICKKTEYAIPIFNCQLATNSEGRPEMQGVKQLEPKLDGCRILLVVDHIQHATCYSRNGKIFENFQKIEDQVTKYLSNFLVNNELFNDTFSDGFVLDGEVVGNTFQELMRQARRKSNVDADDSVFHIFDILPLKDFKLGHWDASLSSRMEVLEEIKGHLTLSASNIEVVPHISVDLDTAEGVTQLHEYAETKVAAGFEGIMIKDINSTYQCKRNTSWMKYKPVHDYDLTVIGVNPGTGKHSGKMGALVCEGIDDGKHITVNVGSGYTDTERQLYWDSMDQVIGKTAVVLADAITQNQDGSYSLRFPRFKTFREDK